MAGRASLFNRESISTLFNGQPCLLLLQALQWDAYIQLTSEIYDILDSSNTPTEIGVVESKIKSFFTEVENQEHKAYSFLKSSIESWRTLRDSHDNNGDRYISTTPEGRAFLALIEQQLLGRPQFTGFSADRLLGSLNKILGRQDSMTSEEALEHHRLEIAKYNEDIERIHAHGVKASQLLTHQVTPLELFTESEQAALSVLVAQDAVKNKVKSVRINLFESYSSGAQSVGKRIEHTADFYRALRATEEHQSYMRARDALSNVEGLSGANYAHKEIPRILSMIAREKIIEPHIVANSPLQRFQDEFEMINEQIDAEVTRQINILKLQVYYATSGDGRLVQEHLRNLTGVIFENAPTAISFLEATAYSYDGGIEVDIGTVDTNSFELIEKIHAGEVTHASMSDEEYKLMVEELRKSEEASIKQVVEKLKLSIAKDGLVDLSEYEITMGGTEFYVLVRAECFDQSLKSIQTNQIIDVLVNNRRDERFWIRKTPNIVVEPVRSQEWN